MIDRLWKYALEGLMKDMSGGFLRPSAFNPIIDQVNNELFVECIREYENDRLNTDMVRPFVVTIGDEDSSPLVITGGVLELPEAYAYLSSVRLIEYFDPEKPCSGQFSQRGRTPRELTDEQFNSARDSQLFKPTVRRPMITVQNNKIRVLPDAFTRAQVTYWKQPKTPFFDWTIPNVGEPFIQYLPPGQVHDGSVLPVGTPSRSVDLLWPEIAFNKLSEKVLFYASRRLKSDPVVQMTKQ